MTKNPSKAGRKERSSAPSLLILWKGEGRGLEADVARFLIDSLGYRALMRFDPTPYFPLDGVVVRDDVAHLPETVLYKGSSNMLIVVSDPPQFEWYRFINELLDVAGQQFKVREIYTLGMMYSIGAHTTPREIFGNFSSAEMKERLKGSGLSRNVDYQTPGNQRPTLSSFLIWLGERRSVSGVNLWVTVPYYLTGVGDPKAEKKVLQFLDKRMSLGIDCAPLDMRISQQSARIGQLRISVPAIDESISKLESGIHLTDEETMRLVREIEKALQTL
jgi:proteasome assembly chaperone (PAC2) family protein